MMQRLEAENAEKRALKERKRLQLEVSEKQKVLKKIHTAASIIQQAFRAHQEKRKSKKPTKGGKKSGKKGGKKKK